MVESERRGLRVSGETSTRASATQSASGLSVAFIPDLRSLNPYQELLAAALERRGIRVRFPEQFGGRRPLLTAVLSREFDVLHIDWIHPYVTAGTLRSSVLRSVNFLLKVVLVRVFRRRIIWTVHNLVSHEARFGGWERRVNGLLARLAHVLVVHYPDAQQIVKKSFRLPAGKEVLVAHHGNYTEAYREISVLRSDSAAQGSPQQPLVFLAFGLVRRYKRLDELIVAFKSLDRDDVRLTIKGATLEEEYAAELQRLARGDARISLELGYVDERTVAEVFAAADIVTVTQADTLTSGSLILAMSMGMPVVAARTPHAEFFFGDEKVGGLLYTPGRTTELADALRQMVDLREELPEMGLANKGRIMPFTWSGMAEEMEQAYRGAD